MNAHNEEIKEARQVVAEMEHGFVWIRSFIEKQHQALISSAEAKA